MDRLDKAIDMANEYNATCDDREECEGCKYYSGNCNLGCLINALMEWDRIISKEPSIQLKNIDLSSVKPNEQMKKFNEEVEEFIIAVEEHNYMALKCKSHMIEEFWDVVQSGLGLLHFEGVEADEVMQGYGKHLLKMEQRGNKPRKKGDN